MKNYKKRLRIGKVMLSSILLMVIFFGCVDMTMLSAQAAKRTVAKAKTSLIYLNNPYSDIILKENASDYKVHWRENPSPVGFFKDVHGIWNVARYDTEKITIYTLDANLKVKGSYKIKKRMDNVGTIAYSDGYTYIVYGQGAPDGDDPAISICKYDRDRLVGEVIYSGDEAYNRLDGTWSPFRSGNCRVAIKNNLLVCFFGRGMYNGHQSDCTVFVNVDSMTKADENYTGPYVSHSFAQRVLFSESGDIYFADQGDAYPRGFAVSRFVINDEDRYFDSTDTVFHFREGQNREKGYNVTYAQMGGLTEVSSGIIFCGSSERTMSLADGAYVSFNESRDVFIKRVADFGGDFVPGESRKAVGKHNSKSNNDKFGLTGNEEDTGIVWLTNYYKDDKYYARSPKIFTTEDDKIGVVWEKLSMGIEDHYGTYLTLLNSDGTILVDQKLLGNYAFDPMTDPVYEDGMLHWVSISPAGDILFHELSIREEITANKFKDVTIKKEYIYNPNMKPDELILKDNGKKLKYGEDFTIGDYTTAWEYICRTAGGCEIEFEGQGKYGGVRKVILKMRSPKPKIQYLKSNRAGTMVGKIKEEYMKYNAYGEDVLRLGSELVEWQYSTDPKFKRDVHSLKGWLNEDSEFYGLSRGKTYYVRARMLSYVDNGDRINGEWSVTRKVKVK